MIHGQYSITTFQYFIGKQALEREVTRGPEWEFVGIEIQWTELENHYRSVGLAPGLPSTAWRTSTPLYYKHEQVGYATSGAWSPTLKKNLALATIRADRATAQTRLEIEITAEFERRRVTARVVATPFFDPPRKKA